MRLVYPNQTSLMDAIRQLQGFRQVIVTGAGAWLDITVPGIKHGDAIVSVANLTDLTMVDGSASKALSNFAGDLDTIIEAHTAGAAGNNIAVTAVGDSAALGGVTINVSGNEVIIHYESGVSTVGNVETAITALAGANNIIDVKTAGTGATVLTAPGDNVARVFLDSGYDALDDAVPTIVATGKVQYPVSTANKKLLITYFVTP